MEVVDASEADVVTTVVVPAEVNTGLLDVYATKTNGL